MHRNIYVNAPIVLDSHLRLKKRESLDLFLAGQITGVEGYMESTAMGLVAGVNAARLLRGKEPPPWPRESAIGSLLHYLQNVAETRAFQPMNMNMGLLPPLPQKIRDKKQKARLLYQRALSALRAAEPFDGVL
jgi:methylenetetrahydrofolate--tRNA-(uracil-5-)-methyltransferase